MTMEKPPVDGHPAELDLLALVEGDSVQAEARAVEAHLAGCAECRAALEAQRMARALLRAAQLVELPAASVRELVRSLPAHPQPLAWWRKRPALVLVPALGVAAAAAAVALTVGGGGKVPPPAALSKAAAAAKAPVASTAVSLPLVRSVAGSAASVVALLELRGIAATVVDGSVVVRRADRARALAALKPLAAGQLRVVAR